MNQTHTDSNIKWEQVFALAALNAAIIISWMAYHYFQPVLIKRFHFEHLGLFVHIAQAAVMILVPLIAGRLADYYQGKNGGSFTVFAIGISIASMLFMSVAFTISDQTFLQLPIGWLLPILIVLWLISMNVFHSPANAILETFTRSSMLPVIMSILAISKQIVLGFEPLIIHATEMIGGTATFIGGGIALIVTGIFFGLATKKMKHEHVHTEGEENRYDQVIMFGLLAGLCNSLLLHFFPDMLFARFGKIESAFHSHIYLSVLLWLAAIASIPLSFLAQRTGIRSSLVVALLAAFVCMIPIILSENYIVCMIASVGLALCYSMISVTAFPYALLNISVKNAIFGTGIFFACFEFFEVMFSFLH